MKDLVLRLQASGFKVNSFLGGGSRDSFSQEEVFQADLAAVSRIEYGMTLQPFPVLNTID